MRAANWTIFTVFRQVEIVGKVHFSGETLPKFRRKSRASFSLVSKKRMLLVSRPGIGWILEKPQGSLQISKNSERVLSPALDGPTHIFAHVEICGNIPNS